MLQLGPVRFAYLAGMLASLGGLVGAQSTWHVDVQGVPPGQGTQGDPYTSIQYAISQPSTVHGDTLVVAPGEYVENVSTMNKRLNLRSSAGPLLTTIRSAGTGTWTVTLELDCELEGFTITQSPSLTSSGVRVASGISWIRRCIIRDMPLGTGILSNYDAYLDNCTVTGNGVGVRTANLGASASLISCILTHNDADIQVGAGSTGVAHLYSLVGVQDPGFWHYDSRDLHLRPGSPAIDAGNPNAPLDPDGSIVDIGALTYSPDYAPAPTPYCTGKQNSQGCTPEIGAVGAASATAPAPFSITAIHEIPNQAGLLFFGFGPRAVPFQGGVHCVAPPSFRTNVQVATGGGPCAGTFSFDMRSRIQSGSHPGLVPGAMVYCQWWSRDPQDPSGFGTGLSNAISFGIAP